MEWVPTVGVYAEKSTVVVRPVPAEMVTTASRDEVTTAEWQGWWCR